MLVEHHWPRGGFEKSYPVWLQDPPAGATAAKRCWVFLDAEFYLRRMDGPATVSADPHWQDSNEILVVYLPHLDQAQRHRDYICSADFSRAILNDLLPWLRQHSPALASGGHGIVGLSLSGLAAAHLAMQSPETFSAAICQSPSFWWEEEHFGRTLVSAGPSAPKFWVSVGRQELEAGVSHAPSQLRQNICQLVSCRRGVQSLNDHGYSAELHEYDGGHDCECWKRELPEALRWLGKNLPATPTQTTEQRPAH